MLHDHVSAFIKRGLSRRRIVTMCVLGLVGLAIATSFVSLALADPVAFSDVPAGHPYYAAISDLGSRGIIGGFPNGTFGPGALVTRQQFAKMVVLTGGYPVSEADVCHFTDVEVGGPTTLFPDNYIAVCAARGITTGKTSTTFDPTGKITRYQVVTMVVRMAGDLHPGLLAQPPADFTGTWAGDPIHGANAARAEYNGLLTGLDLATLGPTGNMTRGEVAVVLHNLLLRVAPSATTTTSGSSASTSTSTTTTTESSTTTSESTTTTSESTTTTTAPSLGYEPLGGTCAPASGPAAASWGWGHIDLFIRGVDNGLYQSTLEGNWTPLALVAPGVITSDPAAVSWGPGRIDVFARGVDDHLKWISYSGGAWGSWVDLGGVLTSSPAVCSGGPDTLVVVVRGLANLLFGRIYAAGTWTDWGLIGSFASYAAPELASSSPTSIDLFAVGLLDYQLYHWHFDGVSWPTPESLGGVCTSGPAACAMPGTNRVDVFVRTPLNTLAQKTYSGTVWSDWTPVDGTEQFQGDPAVVSWGTDSLDLFGVGADYQVWHKWWEPTGWYY